MTTGRHIETKTKEVVSFRRRKNKDSPLRCNMDCAVKVKEAKPLPLPDMEDIFYESDALRLATSLIITIQQVAQIVIDYTADKNDTRFLNFKVVKLKKLIKANGINALLSLKQQEYIIAHPIQYINWLVEHSEQKRALKALSSGKGPFSTECVSHCANQCPPPQHERAHGVIDSFHSLNGNNGSATNTDDIKDVSKGKGKVAPQKAHKPKAPKKPHPMPKKGVAPAKGNIESMALAPAMDNDVVYSKDSFYFGTYVDKGTTTLTSDGSVKDNQILFCVPVNPHNIVGVSRIHDVIGGRVPPDLACTQKMENSYQFAIQECVLRMEGLMPSTISGKVGAFYTSRLDRIPNSNNVMSIYQSIKPKRKCEISLKGKTSFAFKTGWAFLDNDLTSSSEVKPTVNTSHCGYIVAFVMSPCTAALTTAESTDRRYGGPLVTVHCDLKVAYSGYEFAARNLDENDTDNYDGEYEILKERTHAVINNAVAVQFLDYTTNPNGILKYCYVFAPVLATPPDIEAAAVNTEFRQQFTGAHLGTTGSMTKPSFNIRPNPTQQKLVISEAELVRVVDADGVPVSYPTTKLGFVDSALKFIDSAIAAFDSAVQDGFVTVFGPEAGDTAYAVAKKLFALALEIVPLLILAQNTASPTNNSRPIWNANGCPYYWNETNQAETLIIGPIKPGTFYYQQTLNTLMGLNGNGSTLGQQYTDAYNFAQANGVPFTIMCVPEDRMFVSAAIYPQPPYAFMDGKVNYWVRESGGQLLVKDTFGQPISGTAMTQLQPDTSLPMLVTPDPNPKVDSKVMCLALVNTTAILVNDYTLISAEHVDAVDGALTPSETAVDLVSFNAFNTRYNPADIWFGTLGGPTSEYVKFEIDGHWVPVDACKSPAVIGSAVPAKLCLAFVSSGADADLDLQQSHLSFSSCLVGTPGADIEYINMLSIKALADLACPVLLDVPVTIGFFVGAYRRLQRYVHDFSFPAGPFLMREKAEVKPKKLGFH